MKKVILWILPACLLVFVSWRYFFSSSVPKAIGYNVLLISIDTCRADFLGCYGNPVVSTPNIDALAKEGVLFENFYSTINTTLAAHSSIFTGLYPRNHGVGRNVMRLGRQNVTLAEILQSKGYATAAFIGSFALASVFGVNQGFQTYEESFLGDASQYVTQTVPLTNRKNKQMEYVHVKNEANKLSRRAEDVNDSL